MTFQDAINRFINDFHIANDFIAKTVFSHVDPMIAHAIIWVATISLIFIVPKLFR